METTHDGRTTRRGALAWALQAAFGGFGAIGAAGAVHAAGTVRRWPADRATPPLALTDLDGTAWALAGLAGRPVLLNFWATWCAPCRAEMPALAALAARDAAAGLVVLTVDYRETAATVRDFVATLPQPFALPVLLDRDGAAARAWTPGAFPTSVLVDRRGVPRDSVIGEFDWGGAAARALLDPLLARA